MRSRPDARWRSPTFLPSIGGGDRAKHPAYEASEIPAGSFGGAGRPEDEVKTISFSHHIVARRGLSESTVAAFTRQLFGVRQSLKNDFPLAAKIETPDTDKDATIPVHPGAAAFVDGEEKTFLESYSDYIWWSLMALSAMGSAGAWFAGYLKKDERHINTPQRERLLDMLAAARHSDSIDELDSMQAEADNILRDTLSCFESGAIEQGTLTAFNIALEQFHNAVFDRKSLLMSIPQNLQRASANSAPPARRKRPRVVIGSSNFTIAVQYSSVIPGDPAHRIRNIEITPMRKCASEGWC
jgi:hypothetical protein